MTPSISIYSHADAVMQPVADITWPIMRSYAERHGYKTETYTDALSNRRIVWDKIPILQLNLDRSEWSLYMDADVMITNHNIKLTDIAEDVNADCLVATDCNGPNFGVFLLRNCDWSHQMLRRAWQLGENPDVTSEQHAMILACRELNNDRVWELPQKMLNSYPWSAYGLPADTPGFWEPSDFIMHLPGMTAASRVATFNRYKDRIVW